MAGLKEPKPASAPARRFGSEIKSELPLLRLSMHVGMNLLDMWARIYGTGLLSHIMSHLKAGRARLAMTGDHESSKSKSPPAWKSA